MDAYRTTLLAALLIASSACFGPGSRDLAAVDCRAQEAPSGGTANPAAWPGVSTAAVTDEGPLEVGVRLAGAAPSGRLLVRVDAPDHPDSPLVGAPAGAAGAGIALAPPGLFQGCASAAPARIDLQAAGPGVEKAWLRAYAARPVRVRVEAGGGGGEVVVEPGESATASWAPGG